MMQGDLKQLIYHRVALDKLREGKVQHMQTWPWFAAHTFTFATPVCVSLSHAGMQFFTCWHSQRKNERRFHLVACWSFGVICLALLPLTEIKGVHQASFVLLILGVVGVFGVEGISISYYLALMGGEKSAGVAIINTIGALGGFAGP